MLKKIMLAAALAIFPAAALATAPAYAQILQTKPREVKMTTEQALALLEVLANKMDRYERVQKDGDKSTIVPAFYQLDIATRMAMARNIAVLKWVGESYERARSGKLMELSNGKGMVSTDTTEGARFSIENRDILSKEQTLTLYFLTEKELRFQDNPFPPPVLAALLPIIATGE